MRASELGVAMLVAGVALVSLASFPVLPVRGAQISDAVAAIGAALVLAGAVRRRAWPRLSPAGTIACVAYAAAACVSFSIAGGSAMRLLGYVWLVGFALAVGWRAKPKRPRCGFGARF